MARLTYMQKHCLHVRLNTYYSGGQHKAQCLDCFRHGLLQTLRREQEERGSAGWLWMQESAGCEPHLYGTDAWAVADALHEAGYTSADLHHTDRATHLGPPSHDDGRLYWGDHTGEFLRPLSLELVSVLCDRLDELNTGG